jgi:hypothetical protein
MLAGMKASTLIEEIERYLAAVDAFRAEGLEPSWRREPPALCVPDARVPSVIGETQTAAEAAIGRYGCKPGTITTRFSSLPAGPVLKRAACRRPSLQ